MKIATNVVVHEPELNPGKIGPSRLRAHGWSEQALKQQYRRGEEFSGDVAPDAPSSKD